MDPEQEQGVPLQDEPLRPWLGRKSLFPSFPWRKGHHGWRRAANDMGGGDPKPSDKSRSSMHCGTQHNEIEAPRPLTGRDLAEQAENQKRVQQPATEFS